MLQENAARKILEAKMQLLNENGSCSGAGMGWKQTCKQN
jgi:hypothetical protein